MTMRRADPVADFERMFVLRRDGFRDLVMRTSGRWDDDEHRGHLAEDLANQPYDLVEDDAGELIAYFAVASHTDHDFLDEIAVALGHRDRGLGSALVRELMERARTRGVPLRLSVFGDNRAIALYQRLGFRVTRVEPPRTKMEWP